MSNSEVLTVEAIYALAKANGIDFTAFYGTSSAQDLTAPRPRRLHLFFRAEAPQAWIELMSNKTEVPVSIDGTRIQSSSGAIDGMLRPGYRAAHPEVNRRRKEVGLEPVFS